MRRPPSSELNAENRLLAQRWAIAVSSLYTTVAIVIVAAMLASGHPPPDKAAVAAKSERNVLAHRAGGSSD